MCHILDHPNSELSIEHECDTFLPSMGLYLGSGRALGFGTDSTTSGVPGCGPDGAAPRNGWELDLLKSSCTEDSLGAGPIQAWVCVPSPEEVPTSPEVQGTQPKQA